MREEVVFVFAHYWDSRAGPGFPIDRAHGIAGLIIPQVQEVASLADAVRGGFTPHVEMGIAGEGEMVERVAFG